MYPEIEVPPPRRPPFGPLVGDPPKQQDTLPVALMPNTSPAETRKSRQLAGAQSSRPGSGKTSRNDSLAIQNDIRLGINQHRR
jgi:hypothetical protein